MSTQRSYADVIHKCKTLLPNYLGFEGLGILFRDCHKNNLFSYDVNFSEAELRQIAYLENKKKQG